MKTTSFARIGELTTRVMLAVLVIPTSQITCWNTEKFSGIEANGVTVSKNGILVTVRKSASPLIYDFKSELKIKGFTVSGEFLGLPHFADVSKQGTSDQDDFPLRIGFIVPGEKRLSGFKKIFASDWVKNLYKRVPPGAGLDHIQFFNVTQNEKQVGQERIHPKSELIHEKFFAVVKTLGAYKFTYTLDMPISAIALWISIDGDDTKSDYDVLISELSLDVD